MDCSVLDIVRESSGMLCSSLPMLLLITLVLIFPVSSISLCQVMTNSHLAHQLSSLLTRHLAHAGIRVSSLTSLFYLQLSQTLVSQALCFPVILTLWMLAKASIFYILKCRDRGKEASVLGFLEVGPRAWSRIAATYIWGCILVVLVTATVVLLEVIGALLLQHALTDMEIDCENSMYAILEVGAMSAYAVGLAPMVIILNLGSVVAGMEESKCGPRALLRVLTLLKRRRLQPALILFLIMGIAITGIEGAFQYRVLGRATLPSGPAASSLLEAPFLIFAHSFLLLFDTIMSVAFYQACQTAADATPYIAHKLRQEEEEEEDHFSIAVHIVEQQCRKIFTSTTTLN